MDDYFHFPSTCLASVDVEFQFLTHNAHVQTVNLDQVGVVDLAQERAASDVLAVVKNRNIPVTLKCEIYYLDGVKNLRQAVVEQFLTKDLSGTNF